MCSSIGFNLLFSYIPENTKRWLYDAWDSIVNLIVHNNKTSIFVAFDEMVGLPDNVIFGMGSTPELLHMGATDIGYTVMIWRFGLLGTILLLCGYIYVFVGTYQRCKCSLVKKYVLCEIVIFFVYLYKLYSINNFGANAIIFIMMGIINAEYQIDLKKKQSKMELYYV